MLARHHVGAAAPGPVTPTSDKADAGNVGLVGKVREADVQDSAKATATAIARAALLGIEAHSIGPGAWLLRHAHGACIGAVYGHEALAAAVAAFEAARDDVLALVQRLGGGGQ
jgi:outer membrane lipoprotein SlyB